MEEKISSLRLEISKLKDLVLKLSIQIKQLKCSHKWIDCGNSSNGISYNEYKSCEKCKIKQCKQYLGRGDYTDWEEYSSE